MNLAFPALCVLLLVLPGILFRKAYSRGALFFFPGKGQASAVNKYPTSNLPLTEEIGVSLIVAIVLHVIWLSLCTWLNSWLHFNFAPNYPVLLYLLHGGMVSTDPLYKSTLDYVAQQHDYLAGYFLSLYLASGILGRASLWCVRSWGLDLKFMLLRLEDHWFYFLFGEIFRFSEFRRFLPDTPKITGTYVSIVVTHGKADVLYKGFLWDFYLDKNGNLDRLLLHNVIRCQFNPEGGKAIEESEGENSADKTRIVHRAWEFERISSQILTVKYADCKTLACTYFSIREAGAIPKVA